MEKHFWAFWELIPSSFEKYIHQSCLIVFFNVYIYFILSTMNYVDII